MCAPAAAGAPAPVQHYDVRSLRGVPVLQEVHQAGGLGVYSLFATHSPQANKRVEKRCVRTMQR